MQDDVLTKNYTQHNVPPAEYRVRPVVRYVVTRYCYPYIHVSPEGIGEHSVAGGSEVIAEMPKEQSAWDIANALAKAESFRGCTVQQ